MDVNDFHGLVCCDGWLDTVHELLEHYEEAHGVEPTQTRERTGMQSHTAESRRPSPTEVADVRNLANTFARTGLVAPKYHELIFNYPATELLPVGNWPELTPPRAVESREKPRAPDDIADLDFFNFFKVERAEPATSAPGDPQPGCVITAIKRLAGGPGMSTLDVVRCIEAHGFEYRLRLTTTWKLANGEMPEVKDFKLTSGDWDICLRLAEDEPWMQLLTDLMERASTRAYLHVQHKLMQLDSEAAAHEEWFLAHQ